MNSSDTPPSAQRDCLNTLAGEVANLATAVAEHAHWMSDVDDGDADPAMTVRVNTTKALWARDALLSLLAKLQNDNS
jgi:hypothetical protein